MDRAYTADYQLITALQAIKGRLYFCPRCNGALHFYPGTKNTPHFRHGKGVPEEVKAACELYSQSLGEYTMYDQELAARQRVRLVLKKQDEEYIFQLKFPLINQLNVNMQRHNMYYTYHCEQISEFQLNTVRLLPARPACEQDVPLLARYTFKCTNERYEKMLGLHISGMFEPFSDGPLIFKDIQGQFNSIPYRKITLSGRFFVVSATPLIYIHSELEVVSRIRYEQFYIYELIMPIEFSDDLQTWFTRILYYTLLAATCHLDILPPVSFKKIGTIVEINSHKSFWLVTNIGMRHMEQRVILVHPNNRRQVLKVPKNQIVELNISDSGDYLLYVDQEVSEILTLRYTPILEHTRNFKGQAIIDNKDALFTIRELHEEKIEFETDLSVLVHTETDINYEIKHGGKNTFKAPIRIDFPTLWSVNVQQPVSLTNRIAFENILSLYEKHYLYPKVICLVEEIRLLESIVMNSAFVYKDRILYYIRRFSIRAPKPIVEIIKEMKDIQ
ncbi:hypothetical protein [Peribacillus sp. S4]|uniref:hypothetical protein n=1 Tax=Peribacillus sp. S4 TaxID=3384451 RepID=UPI0039895469